MYMIVALADLEEGVQTFKVPLFLQAHTSLLIMVPT